jgi:hypothetical protein
MTRRMKLTSSTLSMNRWVKNERGRINDPQLLHPKHLTMTIHNCHAIIGASYPTYFGSADLNSLGRTKDLQVEVA